MPEVHKFGGTSLATAARIAGSLGRIEPEAGDVIVVSAPAGVTDALLRAASSGDRSAAMASILDRYREIGDTLLEPADAAELAKERERWLHRVDGATRDELVARGELWQARLIALWLEGRGYPARFLDAREFLEVDAKGRAVNLPAIARALGQDGVTVLPGYVARTATGTTVTLGRDGSDYTAAVAAAAIGARRLTLWTDTHGLLTADPAALGAAARRLEYIDHGDAQRIARLGPGVLHARSLEPLADAEIPVVIRNALEHGPATWILRGAPPAPGGPGLFAAHDGVSGKVTLPLGSASESAPAAGRLAARAGARALPGVPGVVELGCDAGRLTDVLRRCHGALYDGIAEQEIVILGRGGVGQALVRALRDREPALRLRLGVGFRTVALADSRTILHLPGDAAPAELANSQATLDHVLAHHPHALVIDATDSEALASRHGNWLARGHGVVTANKRAVAGADETAHRLLASSTYRHDATVGAGLPILEAARRLTRQGDAPDRIDAVLSGSLAAILDALRRGERFEQALDACIARGLVEPDPANDLAGQDVVRKTLILLRTLGHHIEPEQIAWEPFLATGADGTQLEKRIATLRKRGETIVYGLQWDAEGARVGFHQAPLASPLVTTDVGNVARFETAGLDGDALTIAGPGAGRAVTAGALLREMVELASTDARGGNRRAA